MKKIGSTWNLWDLHIHTNASDGKGTCQEILEVVKSKGISCIAVTDHHTIDNIEEMKNHILNETGIEISIDGTVIKGVCSSCKGEAQK